NLWNIRGWSPTEFGGGAGLSGPEGGGPIGFSVMWVEKFKPIDITSVIQRVLSAQTRSATSFDPNDKFGPVGFGQGGLMARGNLFPSRMDFENEATATAPAQRVAVTDQLDPNLDWSTFQLTDLGFGDTLLSVPAGSQHYLTTVDMTYNGKPFQVQVEAGLN